MGAAEAESLLESLSVVGAREPGPAAGAVLVAGAGHSAEVAVAGVLGGLLHSFSTVHAGQTVEAAVDNDLDELLE